MAQPLEQDVVVSAKTNRIAALDIIRGYFLIVILIDHIQLYPSFFDLATGRGTLFVSAAEGFFFMSGLLVGLVYKRRLAHGLKFIARKMWRRALELYAASVFLTLLFSFWAVASHHTNIKYGLPNPINWPHVIEQTLLMRFGYGWADFLDRFAILMFMAPLAFYLIAKGRWKLMLVISFGLWLIRGNNFTLSWQILFNSAMLIGFYWYELRRKLSGLKRQTRMYIRRTVLTISAITFTISYASVFLLTLLNERIGTETPWLRHLTLIWNNYNADVWVYAQKWTMGPLRIALFFLWFASLFYLVEKYQAKINERTKGIVELLGRNSLFVYVTHAFVVFIFWMFIPSQTNIWENFFITLGALIVLIAITVIYRPLRLDWSESRSFSLRSLIARTKSELAG